eukprot:m.196677 g.196677  ORF g.196677 m.196677 type:complete len:115 (+) comp14909_c1_seq14:2026-2370(+)
MLHFCVILQALGVLQRHRARAVQLEQHDSPLNSPLFDVEKNTFQPAREDYSPTSRPGSAPVPYHATPETREFTFKAAVVDLDDEGEDSRFSDILPTPQQSPSTPLAVDASASSA